MLIVYNEIYSLPSGLWDSLVAKGDVCLDKRLISVAERVMLDYNFRYYVEYKDEKPIYVCMVVSLGSHGITGTDETTGLHFWFDESHMSLSEFMDEIIAVTGCQTVVFRDFIDGDHINYTRVMDVSTLIIPQNITTIEQYISTLKYKYRYQLAQYRGAIDRERYTVERVVDYMPLIDELYPLYIDVCARANEYKAEPYPKEYFGYVKSAFRDDAVMIVIRENGGNYLGFMLLLYNESSCVHQYIGFKRIDALFLWHNLTIESIGDAVKRGIRNINMGVTNSVAKHKFGAKSNSCFCKELSNNDLQ